MYVVLVAEKRSVYGVLVGKPGRKRQLGRRSFRCQLNIKKELKEIEY